MSSHVVSCFHVLFLFVLFSSSLDSLLRTPKRAELIYHLLRSFETLTGHELKTRYGERLYVGDTITIQRDIMIPETQKIQLGTPHIVQPNMMYAR
jgi:hypothetical protein